MEKNEIINLIKDNLVEIIPELEGEEINNREAFIDFGANSIDRGELITLTLEALELDVSRIKFVSAQNIEELAELVFSYIHASV